MQVMDALASRLPLHNMITRPPFSSEASLVLYRPSSLSRRRRRRSYLHLSLHAYMCTYITSYFCCCVSITSPERTRKALLSACMFYQASIRKQRTQKNTKKKVITFVLLLCPTGVGFCGTRRNLVHIGSILALASSAS